MMFSIRRLIPADVPALDRLQAQCFPASLQDTQEDILHFVNTALVALGAFDNTGTLVGEVLVVQPSDGTAAELYAIETVPELRRQGIGISLARTALQATVCRPIVAYCTPAGQRLLTAVGFKATGRSVTRGAIVLAEMRLDTPMPRLSET